MSPKIVFPLDSTGEDSDEDYLAISAVNGWLRVWIELDSGWRLPMTFMKPGTIIHKIEAWKQRDYVYYTYYEGLIIVEEITLETMDRALADTWESGFFKSLPVPPKENE